VKSKKSPTSSRANLQHLQAFLDKTHGQVAFGEIPPIRRAAYAAIGKKMHVALVAREGESVAELLQRLDVALGKAMAEGTVIDEVLPEIRRQNRS
jgi:hypothetical protein